jgi:hypothetical protein
VTTYSTQGMDNEDNARIARLCKTRRGRFAQFTSVRRRILQRPWVYVLSAVSSTVPLHPLKQAESIPVVPISRINDPALAEQAHATGTATCQDW